jgi:hypothetical protein
MSPLSVRPAAGRHTEATQVGSHLSNMLVSVRPAAGRHTEATQVGSHLSNMLVSISNITIKSTALFLNSPRKV